MRGQYSQLGVTKRVNKWTINNWYKSNTEPIKNYWVKGHAYNKGNEAAITRNETAIKILLTLSYLPRVPLH